VAAASGTQAVALPSTVISTSTSTGRWSGSWSSGTGDVDGAVDGLDLLDDDSDGAVTGVWWSWGEGWGWLLGWLWGWSWGWDLSWGGWGRSTARTSAGCKAGGGWSWSDDTFLWLWGWDWLGWRGAASGDKDVVLGTIGKAPVGVVGGLALVGAIEANGVDVVGPVLGNFGALDAGRGIAAAELGVLWSGKLGAGRATGDVAVETVHVHLVGGVLTLPEPGADALSAGAGRHVLWNLKCGATVLDTVGVDGEDGELVLVDAGGIALVGNGESATTELLLLEWSASVHGRSIDWAWVVGAVVGVAHASELAVAGKLDGDRATGWELEDLTGLGGELAVEPPLGESHLGEWSGKFMTVSVLGTINGRMPHGNVAHDGCWESSVGEEGKELHSCKESKNLIKEC